MIYFSSSTISLIRSIPFSVSLYVTAGGLSAVISRVIRPAFSSSFNRLANVRRTTNDFRESTSSLNLLGPFCNSRRVSLAPFLANSSSNGFHYVTVNASVKFKYLIIIMCHLVPPYIPHWKMITMPKVKGNKYPELIEYYRKKGYRVEADCDLRDLHSHLPVQLYVQLMTKACGKFSRERGRVSKAIVEAVEKWVKDEEDA